MCRVCAVYVPCACMTAVNAYRDLQASRKTSCVHIQYTTHGCMWSARAQMMSSTANEAYNMLSPRRERLPLAWAGSN